MPIAAPKQRGEKHILFVDFANKKPVIMACREKFSRKYGQRHTVLLTNGMHTHSQIISAQTQNANFVGFGVRISLLLNCYFSFCVFFSFSILSYRSRNFKCTWSVSTCHSDIHNIVLVLWPHGKPFIYFGFQIRWHCLLHTP